jgi:hypothetical protein
MRCTFVSCSDIYGNGFGFLSCTFLQLHQAGFHQPLNDAVIKTLGIPQLLPLVWVDYEKVVDRYLAPPSSET